MKSAVVADDTFDIKKTLLITRADGRKYFEAALHWPEGDYATVVLVEGTEVSALGTIVEEGKRRVAAGG